MLMGKEKKRERVTTLRVKPVISPTPYPPPTVITGGVCSDMDMPDIAP